MNLIKIAAMDSGAHENRNSPWETTVPEGWAVIPARVTIPDSFPFVDMTVEDADGVPTVTALQADTDSLLVEQEYRLTLLEQGISSTDNA